MDGRIPLNPEELEEEERVAETFIHEEEAQRHAAWIHRHEEGRAAPAGPGTNEDQEFQVRE